MRSVETLQATLERIGFDATLETAALERISDLDVPGCRKTLGRMLSRLDLSRLDGDGVVLTSLLVDILQKVNQRVYEHRQDDRSYLDHRLAIFSRCASFRSAEELVAGFMPLLNQLLASLAVQSRPIHPLAQRATEFIDRNYHRRLSLSSVADSLAVSPAHLSRVFRRETGATLTSYIQRIRIERSIALLAQGSRSIAEIAYKVGYQNYRDFYRNFVKFEGASPRSTKARLRRRRGGEKLSSPA